MAAHDGLAEVLEGQDGAPAGQAEVGYRRPPVSRRFKKGQRGNPNGRPKGSRNVHKLLKELLNQAVPVREGNRTRSMLKGEAMIRVLVRKALQADERALRAIMSALQMTGRLDELNDAERAKYGVLVVPEPLRSTEEWELLYGPHLAADRKRYLAMSDDLQADFRAAGEKNPPTEPTQKQQSTTVAGNQGNCMPSERLVAVAQTRKELCKVLAQIGPDVDQHGRRRVKYTQDLPEDGAEGAYRIYLLDRN